MRRKSADVSLQEEKQMEYVTLGKTGLSIARVGFGGIPIQRIDAAGTKELVHRMKELGVNFIDTARAYTVSEEFLGEALEGIRDSFVLATKSVSRTKEAMAADIETSLKNLRTNYIDLYQIHNPNMDQLNTVIGEGGALEALLEAKEQGKIGHIGVTAHHAAVFEKALELPWVETIMFPYNIVETQGEELIARCAEKNIGFICMKPLAGGAIEDPEAAMEFILANPAVTVVIPGMYDVKELEQNVAIAEQFDGKLTADIQAKMDQIRQELGSNFCRRCNYCAPCSQGIAISSVFLFEGYLARYGLEDWAKARYASLDKKASDCIQCGVCETRCPYELPIREMLAKAAEEFGE